MLYVPPDVSGSSRLTGSRPRAARRTVATSPSRTRHPWFDARGLCIIAFGALVPLGRAQDSRPVAAAQEAPRLAPALDTSALSLREIGPASMGGRVVDLAVDERNPSKFYVATASGGLWKTVNNGTTFTPQFQNEVVMSIGDIAIDPMNSDHIWIGTGEANNRNSTSWGNGVYYSADGGKTWKHKGLDKTRHIGRIVVDPEDPRRVFVAACGDLWAPNAERGLYRSLDAGETWELVLAVDDKTGATDVILDPEDPSIVYAAMYERQRDAFDGNHPLKRWGPGSGIYKSVDGGTKWKKLSKGLPTVQIGRVSFDIYRKDPSHIYALIETEKIGARPEGAPALEPGEPGTAIMGIGQDGSDAAGGAKLGSVTEDGPAAAAGLKDGDVVLSIGDEGTSSYADLLAVLGEQRANDKQKVAVLREGKVLRVELTFGDRRQGQGGGGAGARTPFADRIGGQVENRQKSQGPEGYQCGGIYLSKDRGETWERINSLNPRPYYFSQIRVDPSDNKNIYVLGIQFHWSFDGGEVFRSSSREITMANVHVDYHALWIHPRNGKHLILGCDGGVNITYDQCRTWETFENLNIGQAYHAVADNKQPYWVYSGYQDNGSWGSPSATLRTEGITNADAFKVGSGDGFVCRVDPEDPNVVYYESQGGNMGWVNVVNGERGRVNKLRDRNWNWNTPFILSHFNAKTMYYGGSKLYKSPDRGRNATAISPVLISEVPQGEERSTPPSLSSIGESPRKPGILWAGTDDGRLWSTQDDGKAWDDCTQQVAAMLPGKKPMWIGSVHASGHADGRAYVAVDGHRSGDRAPHVFVTEDFGATWKSLVSNLPPEAGSARCVRDDNVNPDLLYLGCEMGLWISLDRGVTWKRFDERFPSVAVLDFDQQDRDQHLIIASHGRGVWVLDIRPLRQLTNKDRSAAHMLVQPGTVTRFARRSVARQGHRYFRLENPPERAEFHYHIGVNTKEKVEIVVTDILGKTVFKADGSQRAGLHRVDWGLREQSAGRPGGAGARGGVARGGRRAAAGRYAVTLRVGEETVTHAFDVVDHEEPLDIAWPRAPGIGEGGGIETDEIDENASTGGSIR